MRKVSMHVFSAFRPCARHFGNPGSARQHVGAPRRACQNQTCLEDMAILRTRRYCSSRFDIYSHAWGMYTRQALPSFLTSHWYHHACTISHIAPAVMISRLHLHIQPRSRSKAAPVLRALCSGSRRHFQSAGHRVGGTRGGGLAFARFDGYGRERLLLAGKGRGSGGLWRFASYGCGVGILIVNLDVLHFG